MESLCKFDPINLPALMLEHMYKTVVEHKGKHGMGYGYFFTNVFHHMNIPVGAEGKGNPLSKVSQLIMEQDKLKHELEGMTVHTKGPGIAEVKELRKHNEVLLAKIVALQEKVIKDNDEANTRLTFIIKSLSHQPPSS
ncbi:hypothetical protein KY290_037065 [Solanum tuberosum]|uniref:Uncharacterized protein n=1 Tax=Solanum tuberosum TaxID=4113 RepID=A0ABQ7TV37_SOLTU|nr:hypothetical protein KY290_037065 [Solanum tuberosum]